MLHTVNKTVHQSGALASALRIARAEDPILFLEDGVNAVRQGTSTEQLVSRALDSHAVYALEPDLRARGILEILPGVNRISYEEFVALVEEHHVTSWF